MSDPMVVFPWLTAAAAPVAAYWVVLTLFTLVNLAVFRRLPPARPGRMPGDEGGRKDGSGRPRVSIVIPARDEERSLGATLDAALAQAVEGGVEVVVVDDGSTDATPEILAAWAEHPRLVALTGEPPPSGWLGKPHALDQGAAAARGEWLLFMDADVRLGPGAVEDAVAHAEARGLDHLALFPCFERRGFWEELLMPSLAATLFVFFPSFLARLERFPRLAFGSGSFNLVRRSAYDAVGGHAAFRDSVVDDIRLASEVKRSGGRSRLLLGDRQARIRMYEGLGEIVEGFTKNLHALHSRHPWFSLFNLSLGTVLQVAPFAWPAWLVLDPAGAVAGPGLLLAGALALALGCRGAVQARLGYPLWPALLHPLMMAAGLGISLRSLVRARGRGEVRWRGRTYRTDETSF